MRKATSIMKFPHTILPRNTSSALHLPLAFGHNAISPGGPGQSHQDAQQLFGRSITKLNLTNAYATSAGQKHSTKATELSGVEYEYRDAEYEKSRR
jgi:hypothetical protein